MNTATQKISGMQYYYLLVALVNTLGTLYEWQAVLLCCIILAGIPHFVFLWIFWRRAFYPGTTAAPQIIFIFFFLYNTGLLWLYHGLDLSADFDKQSWHLLYCILLNLVLALGGYFAGLYQVCRNSSEDQI